MSIFLRCFKMLALCLFAGAVTANGLPVTVDPKVIKVAGDEGDVLAASITIANAGQRAATIKVQAVNWTLDVDGQRLFNPVGEQADDCRAWWQAGYDDLLVQPGAKTVHSINISIPEDLDDEMECRFAVSVHAAAGEEEKTFHVPVYVNAEGAEPELEVEGLAILTDGKHRQPVVMMKNLGTAHARVVGMLEGEDAQGQELELVVRGTEILPGETRAVPLLASKKGGGELWWSPPLQVSGRLMWGSDEIEIDEVLK